MIGRYQTVRRMTWRRLGRVRTPRPVLRKLLLAALILELGYVTCQAYDDSFIRVDFGAAAEDGSDTEKRVFIRIYYE